MGKIIIRFINIALFLMFMPFFVLAEKGLKSNDILELLVYKTPSCGCCKKWINHLESAAIVAHSKDIKSLGAIKSSVGIRPNYRSCHTAISKDGFVFEGHVPAKFIKQFISEQQGIHQDKNQHGKNQDDNQHTMQNDAIGLSVPAMPVGLPGMEVGNRFMPYNVLVLFKDGSSKVYAEIKSYEEQF